MKSSKENCICHEMMENKLDWIKDLMSLHNQHLKVVFFHSVRWDTQIKTRTHITVCSCNLQ